ncbi:MAG: PEGA domain-containing protein [Gammaproteobacteria bacterium]|nr:MAG: PEGA domain-containing protein [Gammaproteobacteria bacterium]
MAENNPRIAQTARQDKQSEPDDFDQITTANDSEADIFADVPSRVTSNDIQVKKHLDTVVESDPTGATNKPEARVITTTNKTSAKSKAEITGSVTMVVSNETERVSQPRSTTGDEESKPIAKKIEMEPVTFVKPKTPPVAKATTGKLIVRSNVNGDMVLINGKPYGKTKLEVNLKPGRYNVEVAKPGYVSWKGATNVYLGKSSALVASLEEYTSVEYRDGQWRGGISTGEGTYIESDGTEYTGSFVNKLFHGKGAIRYPDGIKYSGDWFEGKMHGQGSLTLANGDVYIGGFRDDQFNGDGTLTKANGDIFSGFWVKGALNGDGSLTTREGLLYVGGFADNLFHGQGDLTYPDGRHYDGSFSNGKYHGKGVETFADGKQYSGQFMDGTYHGHGEILNPNGSKISGTFKFGKPYGKAKLTTPEGEIFTARTNEPGVCYREKSYRATQCPPMEGW